MDPKNKNTMNQQFKNMSFEKRNTAKYQAKRKNSPNISYNGPPFCDVGQNHKPRLFYHRVYCESSLIIEDPGLCPQARQTEPRNMGGLERAG